MNLGRAILIILILIFSLPPLFAQKDTVKLEENIRTGIVYYYPSFVNEADYSILSGIYELHGEFKLSENLQLFAVMPFSTYSDAAVAYSGFGNLIVGAKIPLSADKSLSFKGGVELPLISEDAVEANKLSGKAKIYELLLFAPDHFTAFGDIEKKFSFVGGYFISTMAGLAYFAPTGNQDSKDELLVPYKFTIGYTKPEMVGISASLVGIFLLTDDADFADRLEHVLRFEIKYPGKIFEPAFRFELPMNNKYSENINYLIGVQLMFKFY